MLTKLLISLFGIILLISLVSADTQVDDSLCGDMSDAGCVSGYLPTCFRDNQGDLYYTCIWDTSQDCSADPSRNLDCSRWCENGLVYDYGSDMCCPQTEPYWSGTGCRCNPDYTINCGVTCEADFSSQITSDNYYTRHTQCDIFRWGACSNPSRYDREKKCEGFNLLECVGTGFINTWENQGIVVGQCGVEEGYCATNFDCPINILIEQLCENNNLIEKTIFSNCINNKCQMDINNPTIEIIEDCDYMCGTLPNTEIFGCIVRQCINEELKCSGNDLLVCQDNEFGLVETCEFGCMDKECNPKPFPIILIIIGVIIVMGGLIFIFIKIRK